MQILVKTGGHKKSRTQIHVYNEATDSALCSSWPKPGAEWEIQEVGNFQDVAYGVRCWHCSAKLMALSGPPKPPKRPTLKERRRQRDLDKLAAWNAGAA